MTTCIPVQNHSIFFSQWISSSARERGFIVTPLFSFDTQVNRFLLAAFSIQEKFHFYTRSLQRSAAQPLTLWYAWHICPWAGLSSSLSDDDVGIRVKGGGNGWDCIG